MQLTKEFSMRFRNMYMIFGGILVLILLTVTDPDQGLIRNLPFGAGTLLTITILAKGILGSGLLYVTRKAMFDYEVADLESIGKDARRTPEGAGLYAISIALQTVAYALIILGVFNV